MGINRRRMMAGISGGLILNSVTGSNKVLGVVTPEVSEATKEAEVTAVEDLMREHGILRRALFVYSETAKRIRKDGMPVSADAIQKTAKLFRTFGEDYHEKKLEEAYIFPAIQKSGGETARIIKILIEQHNRGHEITEYILSVTRTATIEAKNIEPLAGVMESMVRMYRPHAAREDTVVFPAWKGTMNEKQLEEIGEKFEDIEHEMFGKDGFEDAVKQISEIEKEFGMADLAQFTAAGPPSS